MLILREEHFLFWFVFEIGKHSGDIVQNRHNIVPLVCQGLHKLFFNCKELEKKSKK
uniref:Uncharacterized protein n=1 Tax=Rhizophora mucronata TaxID=61149 RepID=A0A2P2PRN1_RHIMU